MTPDEFTEIDARLRDAYAFAPGAAEECAARFRVPPRRPIPRLPLATAAGVAAGFLLRSAEPEVLGFVTVATDRAVPAGTRILAGREIALPAGARASVVLADGSELRLHRGSRLLLMDPRRVQ